MPANSHFEGLVKRGNPAGEVTSVNKFVVQVRGLHPVEINALVMFEDGSKGIVREVETDHVIIFHLGTESLKVGMGVAKQHSELVTKVGKGFLGRVVSVNGEPLDGKGSIAPDGIWPVFNEAPPLIDRQALSDQLETGVSIIDTLFPLVKGQRIALLGDSKSGKSSVVGQLATSQSGKELTVVYALVAKRQVDVDALINILESKDALKNAIVVVSNVEDSLVNSYLAPYVACSMAEYLWQKEGRDVVVVYDDLTAHAQAYREISLLAGTSPGRDSYPGDIFYIHSSLLERAGRLKATGKTLTALSVVHVPGGEITAYLPTNIISITDGQLVFDLDLFRKGQKPAVNIGLSVSRIGGIGHSKRQKSIANRLLNKIALYNEAEEFSHFGSELALETKSNLEMGKRLLDLLQQNAFETYSLVAQQLMFESALNAKPDVLIDTDKLKEAALKHSAHIETDEQIEAVLPRVLEEALLGGNQ